jgi:biopolymer transport protein ExbB
MARQYISRALNGSVSWMDAGHCGQSACPMRRRRATVATVSPLLDMALLALIEAAGWPIWPLIIASILALAIIFERFYTLRRHLVVPAGLLEQTLDNLRKHGANVDLMRALAEGSALGRVLATGLRNVNASREIMKESLDEAGRAVGHDLERYLSTLGTIASVAPLMGLLGTVVGMVEIFGSQSPTGGSNPAALAHGISIALYNTAFGLIVAIPSLIFYRFFRGRVDAFLVEMEQEALRLVDIVHGDRK